MSVAHFIPRPNTWRSTLFLAGILFAAACDSPTAPDPVVAGTVTALATGKPVAGVQVSVGADTVRTGPDGRFELRGLAAGPATLRASAASFEPFEVRITVASSRTTRDIPLTRIDLVKFAEFALYIPATVETTRGVIVALGGPDTRGFASGQVFGAPLPAVETALQEMGREMRAMAAARGMAVLGTSRAAMPNTPASDEIILKAIKDAANLAGRPELASAPLLLYGISGGGPQSSGFTLRNPMRVAGLFLKVPSGVQPLSAGAVLGVPTFMVQAELDAFVNNGALATVAEANRGAGALWARALEPGVVHHSLSPAQRSLTTNWLSTILDRRLGDAASDPMRAVAESSGWLGDPLTGAVASWGTYSGNRQTANWFPTRALAEEWRAFIGPR